MPGTIATYPAGLFYEVAFNTGGALNTIPPQWTDLTARTKPSAQQVNRGRQYELDTNQAGTWRTGLENKDGALDPTNTASPYAPNVIPFRQCRIRAMTGVNALTVDQATAGGASGYVGAIPGGLNVSNDFGYTPTIVTSGTAYQGGTVYQVALPSGAGANTTVLLVTGISVVPGATYSFSAQVRIPSGTSTATNLAVLWYDQNGNSLTPVSGTAATPTSGSASWTAVGASGTAPKTALSATLKIQIASGSTAATTTWQADALQWEQSASVTPFQIPQTLSANLLPRAVATGTASINPVSDSASNWFYPIGAGGVGVGTVTQATNLTAAPSGQTTAAAWTTPSGTTSTSPLYAGAAAAGPCADCVQVTAGLAYSTSVYLMRTSSADTTVQVQVWFKWYGSAGNLLGTFNGTAATVAVGSWVRATLPNLTAPAGAVWGRPLIAITTPVTTTASNTIYATGWQVEQATAVSAWMDPGPTYEIITGYVERWPQTWIYNGTYGVSGAVGLDALAALAQYTLQAPFIQETLALGPDFFYPLADPSGATSVADSTGKRVPAPIENSPYGAGSLTLGSSVTANTAGSAFIGTPGPVATFANNPSQANAQEPQTYISLHKTTTTPGPPVLNGTGPAPVNGVPWTRMIAFRCSTTPAAGNFPTLWCCNTPSYGSDQSFYQLYLNPTSGKLSFQESGSGGTGPLYTSAATVCDGNWHQVFIVYTGASGTFQVFLDGALAFSDNNGGAGWTPPTNISTDVIGAFVVPGHNAYVLGWVGDAAHAAQFPAALTAAQISALYSSWRTASSGESTGARAARVLKWIGWSGTAALDTGQTTSMGPATDLTGATALDALGAIALTESGNLYAANSGAVTLTSRTRRYNQTIPAFVFGENTSLGEWPYEAIDDDYDPQHLFNWIQVTQAGSGQVANAQDSTSQGLNFPRILQRSINPSAFAEASDAANYLLQQYKTARRRISNLTLNPGAVPGLFAVCLQLDIGARIRVMRRPPGAPVVQFDGFVESVSWSISPDGGGVTVQLQCSPADLGAYWTLGALHTTLSAQASSGQNQASIHALPDSAVNALASSLPQGYQLTFDPGTAIAETMTLAPTGIPATTPGYTSATLTFTSNFAFTHQANAAVCEPLPTGYTDPTRWDSASVLGGASCAVVSGGASGTNTITLGPLGDGAVNPLACDWATGDLLWVSPGTPRFEGYNVLHPNVSTAGEGALPLAAGATGTASGVGAFYADPTVTASATAWQGVNVWATSVAGGATTGHTLINVAKVPVTAGLPFTWSVYTRSATSSQNPQVHPNLQWLDAGGNSLGSATGGTVTLTGSPTASWTRLIVSGTAPAGAVWAAPGVFLDVAPSGGWVFHGDGLQVEQAASASVFCVTPQVKSVAAAVPGYSSVTVTVNSNFINNHNAGDVVCDPLPPGTADPTVAAAVGTSRIAY